MTRSFSPRADGAQLTSRQRVLSAKPSDSDGLIALWLAEYLLEEPGRRNRYYLSVLSDRPVSLPFTHHYKNVWTFVTESREAAAGWIVQAALAGYGVLRGFDSRFPIGGLGTISDIRERATQ